MFIDFVYIFAALNADLHINMKGRSHSKSNHASAAKSIHGFSVPESAFGVDTRKSKKNSARFKPHATGGEKPTASSNGKWIQC